MANSVLDAQQKTTADRAQLATSAAAAPLAPLEPSLHQPQNSRETASEDVLAGRPNLEPPPVAAQIVLPTADAEIASANPPARKQDPARGEIVAGGSAYLLQSAPPVIAEGEQNHIDPEWMARLHSDAVAGAQTQTNTFVDRYAYITLPTAPTNIDYIASRNYQTPPFDQVSTNAVQFYLDLNRNGEFSNTPSSPPAVTAATPLASRELGTATGSRQEASALPQALVAGDNNVNGTLAELSKGAKEEMKTDTLSGREQFNASKTQPADTNQYSLNAVGYINVQLEPATNTIILPTSNGAIGLQGGTAPASQLPSAGSAIDRPGNSQVASANFYVDKDTGKVFSIGDDKTTAYASQVISNSNPSISVQGAGLIGDGDRRQIVGGATSASGIVLPQPSSATTAKATEPADITYNYSSVPVDQLLSNYSELTGRTILRSSAGPGGVPTDATISLKTQTPLTHSEAARALETVLGLNGIAVVPIDDKSAKVVTEAAVGGEGGSITTNASNPPETRDLVTQIFHVTNTDVADLADVLRPFSKAPKGVLALPATQTLIVRDTPEYVARMDEMIKKIDVASARTTKPEVIPMQYASASDVASALNALGASGGAAVGKSTPAANLPAPGGRSSFQQNLNKVAQNASAAEKSQTFANAKVIADERDNSVLVFANDEDKKKIEDVLKKLDVAAPQVAAQTAASRSGGTTQNDAALPRPALPPPIPQPEVFTSTNVFSTFSLNVSDASFKLAAASLQNGVMPEAGSIRSEEFINAFDYRDPEPAPGAPIAFAWERAGYPFAHNRDLLRFSVKTASQGRQEGRPLNLVLLLDKSGSMERADRVEIIHQALRVLASQLRASDTLSVVVFARTARLWVDGVPGTQAGEVANGLSRLTPEGGTNLEEAMRLAYETALRHYQAKGDNRVVLLTDGAANLGDVKPETLQQKVEANRKQGIALDCFGVGWDGYNDTMMETLSRAGHGRYGFINTPEEAATEFAGKLAGALRVAASDVKVQVEFNPKRVTAYRQIGYAKHQLTQQQFRDNTVAAAQIGAAESGNALYTVQVNAAGDGPLCTVRVRFRLPGTSDYQEHAWDVPYTGTAAPLDQSTPAMRLAATASAFSEWLAASPYAGEVTPDQLLADLRDVPEIYGADPLPKKLEWMIRQSKSLAGK